MRKILKLVVKYLYNQLNLEETDIIKDVLLENMAMRQQLSTLKHKERPRATRYIFLGTILGKSA